MAKGLLDVEGLKRYAKDYDSVLRMLPLFTFKDFAAKMKLNIIEVQNEDVLTHYRRKAGNTGAYKTGAQINYPDELGKIVEMSLKTELTVSRIKDNVLNYGEKKYLSNAGESVDNVTKKHPLEKLYVDNIIKSHAEDITFSTFFASRDESQFSPLTAFTGFFPTIDALKMNNDINQANRNLVPTGAFGSGDGVCDYDRLVNFIRQAHPLLKRNGAILYYSDVIELVCVEALRVKTKSFSRPTSDEFWNCVKADAKCPGLQPITHEAYGSGSALILIKPGMLDMGVNTLKAANFVQIRDIYEDPNDIQMWLQAAYGTRIQDVHEKVFQINEFTNESVDLAGDYVKGAALTVQTEPATAGWRIVGDTDWMQSGKTKLGVPSGSVVIEFKEVEGFTKPANKTISVTEGLDFNEEGNYTSK